MDSTIQELQGRIAAVEVEITKIAERNRRVEADKAWETSLSRFMLVLFVTYLTMCLVFFAIGAERIFINAIVPTCGYVLSTFSFPLVKRWWVAKWYS